MDTSFSLARCYQVYCNLSTLTFKEQQFCHFSLLLNSQFQQITEKTFIHKQLLVVSYLTYTISLLNVI